MFFSILEAVSIDILFQLICIIMLSKMKNSNNILYFVCMNQCWGAWAGAGSRGAGSRAFKEGARASQEIYGSRSR